jgi:epoxyqueuosine reductase
MDLRARADKVKGIARHHGFAFAGIARAEHMAPEARRLEKWLGNGYHGKMGYMEGHFDLRTDPTKLVPGAKSVVSLLYNYYSKKQQTDPQAPKISMYAFGKDYHKVIRKKLKTLLGDLRKEFGDINGRCFVDSAPVLERDWARRAGVGWTGKNTLLINPKAGSYFFLSELIIDLELEPDTPIQDHCGTCTKCIEACPTDAIAESGYILDASRCISYLTIELREEIPTEFKDSMENLIFGCDICQDVCPWNRFSQPHQEPQFEPDDDLLSMSADAWHEMTEDVFENVFRDSAVKRTKYTGLRRNLDFVQNDVIPD